MENIYEKIIDFQKKGETVVLCTIVNTKGSTPRKVGAKMIVQANGNIIGTIGGGDLEKKVVENANTIIKTNKSQLFKHDLLHQHGMCCGGTVEIYLEPIMKKNKLYLFGAGHTGQSLAKLAVNYDFEIVLIDDRKEYIDQCNSEQVNKMHLPFDQALRLLPFDDQTFICIMTYDHPIDREILAYCLKKPFAYLGMIGSERKVMLTKKMFREGLNFSEEELESIDMPMGMDIGAEGPDEIALSILTKLVAVKNKKTLWEKELQL